MLASYRWLKELSGLDIPVAEAAGRLTAAGIEVEAVEEKGRGLEKVVIAEVRATRPHPEREALALVTVFDGGSEHEVVCGAPNLPGPGGRVVYAGAGAVLPGGVRISERKFGSVVSQGMICSEAELEIGSDSSGIIVLDRSVKAWCGDPVADALELRDSVLDIGLTPNRPDCLGHLGLARELCVLRGRAFRASPPRRPARVAGVLPGLFPQRDEVFSLLDFCAAGSSRTDAAGAEGFEPVRIEIEDAERCPRYGAALVGKVTVGPSPFQLRYRLHVLGLRAINNVVDATNIILLGLGHPIHAFDYDRLRGSRIVVRLANRGEVMETLDGQKRRLTDDDLLICDGEGPVALAGVMGGANSEIGEDTRRVLIECAYFDPRSIRRTAKRTGLHTDSSYRFERGVDAGGIRSALANTACLVAGLAGAAVVGEALDVEPAPRAVPSIRLRQRRAESLLGRELRAAEVRRTLVNLGCTVERRGKGEWKVLAPSFRPDLLREVDLIEEVARVGGYDAIPTEIPAVRPSPEGTSRLNLFIRRLREAAAAAGLTESVNYAFVAPKELELSRQSTDAVRLSNPLSEERSVLRTSLLPSLAANLRRAQNHQVDRFAGFELARLFEPAAPGQLPGQRYALALLLWGPRRHWYGEREQLDFYDGKGMVKAIFGSLGNLLPQTCPYSEHEAGVDCLHPGRRSVLRLSGEPIGRLGELHPEVVEGLQLQGRPVFASIDVQFAFRVVESAGIGTVKPLPRYPSVVRDIAVVVDEAVPAGDVARMLQETADGLAEEVGLFDIYRGAPVPKGYKSMAFHVVYRDTEATLTDRRVDEIHERLVKAAESSFSAMLRARS